MKKLALTVFLILFFTAAVLSAEAQPVQVVPQSRPEITLSFAPLVKAVAPAVVNIYTERKVQQRVSPMFSDPFFQQFFGNMAPPGFTRERLENSLGSGVIVRPDGLIVTSNHVIADADEIRVVLADRREFPAHVITADTHSDLAVLQVETKGEKLPYLELKDSDDAQVGDLVLAIGDPFGVGQTVTSGIISAIAHGALGSSDLGYYIQTDAAINPGNSGGALVTMDGKLVGINAAIYSQSGGSLGIGFAVPSNLVRVVLGAVAQGKKSIVQPWLGIEGQELTPDLAASMNIAQPSGILVNHLRAASPATKAGLYVGDVIIAVNGRTVEDMDTFRYRIATLGIGATATIGIIRKGQKLEIPMTIIPPPEIPPREKTEITGHNPLAGATIENLSPAVIEELNVHGVEEGIVVAGVKNGSAAANMGLQTGDMVVSINGAKVAHIQDVTQAVPQANGGWRVEIRRGDNVVTVMVRR